MLNSYNIFLCARVQTYIVVASILFNLHKNRQGSQEACRFLLLHSSLRRRKCFCSFSAQARKTHLSHCASFSPQSLRLCGSLFADFYFFTLCFFTASAQAFNQRYFTGITRSLSFSVTKLSYRQITPPLPRLTFGILSIHANASTSFFVGSACFFISSG